MTDQELELLIKNWKGTPGEIEQLTAAWHEADEKAIEIGKPIVARELLLRKLVADLVFTAKVEGAKNRTNLPAGWALKLTHSIERKVEEPMLDALSKHESSDKPSVLEAAGINVDNLIRWKPELRVKEYKELSDDQKRVFDQALKIYPGTPQLELLPPGKK